MPNLEKCAVDILSAAGNFKVEVLASSLYEAAALAIQALREDPFVPADFNAETATIQVRVARPAVVHCFPAERLFGYVRSSGAPNQMGERNRLRAIIEKTEST